MKKLLNLQSSFSNIDTSWTDKTPIISTETDRMVTNLSKNFLQIQLIFIVSNQKQMIFVFRRPWSLEKKLLIFKSSSNNLTQNKKAISNYISSTTLCNIVSFISLIPTDWHQQKPLCCSEFPEANYLFKRYVYIVAYLGIILHDSWHILEGN